jgi:hypothetical protein
MYQITQEARDEIAEFIADAEKLPLRDGAWMLQRYLHRLNTLEGRPTPEQVQAFRAMTPEQQSAHMKHEREHADEGPLFGYLQRAHPSASDTDIRSAILEAVRFQDDCSTFLRWDGDYWECIVRAVAEAEAKYPGFREETYRAARNYLAYLWK